MAVQSIFALLDVLTSWTSKAKRKSSKSRTEKDNQEDKEALDTTTSSSSFFSFSSHPILSSSIKEGISARGRVEDEEEEHPFMDDPCQCIIALLSAVPKELLGRAALRIKAYARALRFFELHAREIKNKLSVVLISLDGTDGHSPLNSISDLGPSIGSKASPSVSNPLALMHCSRNDGSNGELPDLDEAQLDRLVEVVSSLEDPDAVQGVQKLRYAAEALQSCLVLSCPRYKTLICRLVLFFVDKY